MRFSTVFFGLVASLFIVGGAQAQPTNAQFINDMNTLNYALALENFEAQLYKSFVATFPTATSFNVSQSFYTYLTQAGLSEQAHAEGLNNTIKASGWVPAPACVYNNSALRPLGNDPAAWLATLTDVENLGAKAYNYASQYLTSAALLQFAATVATVEARHASFLNLLSKTSPFPSAIESASSLTDTVNIFKGFLVSCPTANGTAFNGQTVSLSVLDHVPGAKYAPQPAARFRKASGTFPLYTSGFAYNSSDPTISAAAYGQDTLVLQYALTLENLEASFYNLALANVTKAAFVAAYATTPADPFFNSSTVYDFLVTIQAHENAHVSALNALLTARNVGPVQPCSYPGNYSSFGFNGTAQGLLAASAALENAGVSAYTGAINAITDKNLVGLAASVALVEARHASYLNVLVSAAGLVPNSASVDTPLAPTAVAGVVAGALGTCPAITVTDAQNTATKGGLYSSLDLPFANLTANNLNSGAGGYNDATPFATATGATSTPTSTGTSGSNAGSSSTGSASTIAASVFAVVAVVALVL